MKRVQQVEHPEHEKRHSLHAEMLAELDRQRVKEENDSQLRLRYPWQLEKRQWRMRNASEPKSLPWRKDMTSNA